MAQPPSGHFLSGPYFYQGYLDQGDMILFFTKSVPTFLLHQDHQGGLQ